MEPTKPHIVARTGKSKELRRGVAAPTRKSNRIRPGQGQGQAVVAGCRRHAGRLISHVSSAKSFTLRARTFILVRRSLQAGSHCLRDDEYVNEFSCRL